jgi:Domain of unknown function (DUF6249)
MEALLTGALGIVFVFGSPVAIVFLVFGFRYLRYVQRQKAIRLAIEKGMDLSPFLAEGRPQPNDPRIYLLRGLLWGLPGLVIGVGVTWEGFQHGMRAESVLGWIPAAIGGAYLLFYQWIHDQEGDAGNSARPAPPSGRAETDLANLKG